MIQLLKEITQFLKGHDLIISSDWYYTKLWQGGGLLGMWALWRAGTWSEEMILICVIGYLLGCVDKYRPHDPVTEIPYSLTSHWLVKWGVITGVVWTWGIYNLLAVVGAYLLGLAPELKEPRWRWVPRKQEP